MKVHIYICRSCRLELANGFIASEYRTQRVRNAPATAAQGLAAEFLLYRALLERGECSELPLNILADVHGKPYIDGGPQFSLSHSGEISCCAVADSPVGIDVQLIRNCSEAAVNRWFSDEEREYLDSAPDRDAAFTGLWAIRESCVKATGGGVGVDMRDVSLHVSGGIISVPGAGLYLSDLGNAWLACCVPGQTQVDFVLYEL